MDLSLIHRAHLGNAGPRVVMVHGGGQGSVVGGEKNFHNQYHLAKEGWQLIVPDRPGHGHSPYQGWPDDAAKDGAWTAELLEEGAHLVGHSFGGAVALDAAARRPGAVRSLTLIEPAMHKLAIDDPHVRKFVFGLIKIALFSFSAETLITRAFRHIGIPPELSGRTDKAERGRLAKSLKNLKLPSKATLHNQLEVVRQANIPLLVVTGGWSEAFDISSARAAKLGGGRHVIIPSPHHFPQIVSGEFSALLKDHMTTADSRAATGTA